MTTELALGVPYVDLVSQHAPLRQALLNATARVLDHGQFIMGPEVQRLEQRWADLCETQHAVSVSNGSMALLMTLRALGVGAGDEVITVANSFVATVSSIVLAGATPRFADVADDFNLDPETIASNITETTKAIIVVHLTGRPAHMEAINEIAADHNLLVIEDAAQAMRALHHGRPVGSLARAGCFSLHPLKTAGGCGDGGMITTNDGALASRLRLLRNHGITKRQEDCSLWGFNARLDTIQAAMALVKLDHVDEWIARRRENASIYRDRLSRIVEIPFDRPDDFAVYHTFPVLADRRDALVEHLKSKDIGCAVHYRNTIPQLAAAENLKWESGRVSVAERQSRHAISLPIHEGLTTQQIETVCDAVIEFYNG